MNPTREVKFTDDVAAQDPDESPERLGVLTTHTTSETATWTVNGENRIIFTWPELDALIEAASPSAPRPSVSDPGSQSNRNTNLQHTE